MVSTTSTVESCTQAEWIARNSEAVKAELMTALKYPTQPVDILLVVHNGLDYLKECIESIRKHTENYRLYLWNNGSDDQTTDWLMDQKDVFCTHVNSNDGFIEPNNALIRHGHSPYVILLNTDTIIQSPLWARAMTSMLVDHPKLGVVGYGGGMLDENCKGVTSAFGSDIDYIEGWCMCFSRDTYEQFGLFDNINLRFAYGEDADFCLRLKEAGRLLYTLHMDCVLHHGQKTIKEVIKTRSAYLDKCFRENHEYLKRRWGKQVYNRQNAP